MLRHKKPAPSKRAWTTLARDRPLGAGQRTSRSRAQLDQLRDRLPLVEQVLRPAAEIGKRRAGVNAEDVVERRQHVLGTDAPVLRSLGPAIGLADNLTGLQTAAREQGIAGVHPVIAARQGNLRRSAHLA